MYTRRRKRKKKIYISVVLVTFVVYLIAATSIIASVPKRTQHESARPANAIAVSATEKHIVALDAGHGGYNPNVQGWDTGCQGNGFTEAELTYDLTARLAQKLEESGQFTVVFTADGENYLLGSRRGKAASEQNAELLLSLHFDTNNDSAVRGFTCYPATPAMETNSESLCFAEALTGQISQLGEPLRGTNGIRYLYFVGENNRREVCESTDTAQRSDPTYTILETCGCPAVLCELGFLSNGQDAALVADEAGRDILTDALYQAILNYFTEVD